jgi:hypothetical protein
VWGRNPTHVASAAMESSTRVSRLETDFIKKVNTEKRRKKIKPAKKMPFTNFDHVQVRQVVLVAQSK